MTTVKLTAWNPLISALNVQTQEVSRQCYMNNNGNSRADREAAKASENLITTCS
jgi:hypothetical protein